MCKVFLDYFHLVQAGGCLVSRCFIEDFTSQLVSQNHNKLFSCRGDIPMEFDSCK